MVNSISNNLPANRITALDVISREQLQAPGKYTLEELLEKETPRMQEKKDSGFIGFLGKLILAAVVIGAGSVALRRYLPALSKIEATEALSKNPQGLEKFKVDFVRFADWVERNTIGFFKKLKETSVKAGNDTADAAASA